MRPYSLPVIAALLLAPVSGSAQSPAALADGRTSLAFALPGSNAGELSVWRFISDRSNLGLALGFAAGGSNTEGDPRQFSISAGPVLKRYFAPRTKVAPFYRLNAGLNYHRSSASAFDPRPEFSQDGYGANLGAGVGVDWFATDDISIGGHTGVAAAADWNDADEDDMQWNVRTFNSALTMHIYF